MKKTRIISILLIVIMLFSSVSTGAYAAADDTVMTGSLGALERANGTMAKRVSGELPRANEPKLANASAYKFYNNLTETEKIIYDGFVSTKLGLNCTPKGNFSIEITNGDRFSENKNDFEEALLDAIYSAAAASIDDNPELFWLLSMPFDYRVVRPGNNYVIYFYTNLYYTPYSSIKELENEYYNTLWAAQNFSVSGTTRYEKVKSITDKLCSLADYADITGLENANNSKIFFPSSCLLSPYKTVCDGYSKAFKMICDANNIPSIIVVGYGGTSEDDWGGHAWNYVQLEDGRWYALDLTWIDSAQTKDYFLIGSNTRDSMGLSFEYTHDPVGDRFTGIEGLTYPKLSPDAFDPTKPIDVLGDVDGDKRLTVADAQWVLQALAEARTLSSTSAAKADVNGDGVITLVDARLILQAVAGLTVLY